MLSSTISNKNLTTALSFPFPIFSFWKLFPLGESTRRFKSASTKGVMKVHQIEYNLR